MLSLKNITKYLKNLILFPITSHRGSEPNKIIIFNYNCN